MYLNKFSAPWISDLRLRYATRSDLAALEWNGEFTHFRRLYQEIYQNFSSGRALMWVVEIHGNEIIGQLFIQLKSHRYELADGVQRAYIYGFRIKPAYRNQGVGSHLLENVELDLSQRRFQWITLNVSRRNLKALRFYKRHGYRIIAEEPGEWSYVDHLGNQRWVYDPAWRVQKSIL